MEPLGELFAVMEDRDAPDALAPFADCSDEARGIALLKERVARGVEDRFDSSVKGADPRRTLFVDRLGEFQKCATMAVRAHFADCDCRGVIFHFNVGFMRVWAQLFCQHSWRGAKKIISCALNGGEVDKFLEKEH